MNIHAHGDGLRRRDEILRIVGDHSVHSQAELPPLLKKRGFKVTQPTLSRDLRELGVAKSPNGYVTRDAFAGGAVVAFAPRAVVRTRVARRGGGRRSLNSSPASTPAATSSSSGRRSPARSPWPAPSTPPRSTASS